IIAWKLDDKYTKDQILGFYLNTVPFGRGTHGAEAAAQTFFHKTISKKAPAAQQLTPAEAMLLVSFVKQPEPDPEDPTNLPGYDPTRGPKAEANALDRWTYVRNAEVKMQYISQAEADKMVFPGAKGVQPFNPAAGESQLDAPT